MNEAVSAGLNHYSLNPRVRYRRVGEDGVVIALEKSEVIVVNALGVYILDMLKTPRTIEQITEQVCTEFEVSLATAQQDVSEYITSLSEQDLIARQG
jgi:methyltransferase-like protein